MTLYLLTTLQQFALFSGVALAVGCVAWMLVVAPGANRALEEPTDRAGLRRVNRTVASMGAAIATALVFVWVLRGAVQLITFRDPFVPLSEDVSFLLFDLFWGDVWMAQGVLVLLLVPAFLAARTPEEGDVPGRVHAGRGMAALLVLALVATLSLSSHAMGVESGRSLAVLADGVHLLAAGTWIGSLTLIVTAGRGGGRPAYAAQLLRFSPMAVVSVSALILMGAALSWTHLQAVSDLWTETYGRVLSAKILLAGVVLLLGFLNWRGGLPNVASEAGAAKVQRQAAIEVSVAMGVLLLTAVLVHSPKP